MKRDKLAVMILAGALMLGSTVAVNAQPAAPAAPPAPAPAPQAVQTQSYEDNMAAANALGVTLAQKYDELNAALSVPAPDKAKIENLAREIGDLRGQLLGLRVDMQNQLKQQGIPPVMAAPTPPPAYYGATPPPPAPQRFHHGQRGQHARHGGYYAPYGPGPMGYGGCPGGCWW